MMMLGVTTGGVFYGEFDVFTPGRWWVFCIGAFFAMWGLLILSFVDTLERTSSICRRESIALAILDLYAASRTQ